ncbi:hypothetical protein IJS77_00470 [bacterium]|nr:hypothetical protein [bacterium]
MFGFFFTVAVILIVLYSSFYKKCPPNSAIVVFDNANNTTPKVITEGGAFVFPLFQDYRILSFKRTKINVNQQKILTKDNLRINIDISCVVAISKNKVLLQNAAERISGLSMFDISKLAKEIIIGHLRLVCAIYEKEKIVNGSNFINDLERTISIELSKIGIEVINIYINSVTDNSGEIKSKKQPQQAKKEKSSQNPAKTSFEREFNEIAKKEIEQREEEKQEIKKFIEQGLTKIEEEINYISFEQLQKAENIAETKSETNINNITAFETKVEEPIEQKDLTETKAEQTYKEQPEPATANQTYEESTPSDDIFASVRHYFESKNQ